ncbi:MAG: two-component regulator propeller domain-containing protein, partial [Bacteroidota bacterium]
YPTPQSKTALAPDYRDNVTGNIKYLGQKEGLSAVIWSMLEDSKGNIWFATFEGVICYDGYSFTRYTKKEGLFNNWVSSIFEDKSGNLWFLYPRVVGGVSCYDGNSFTHYKTDQGLCSNIVNSMLQDKNGLLWFATSAGLSCFNGKSFINYSTKQGLCNNYALDMLEDKSGKLWIGTMGGISSFDGKSFTNYIPKNGFYKANSILEDKSGKIWFTGYGTGLSCFDGESLTYYTKEQGLCSNNIILNHNLLEDNRGNIWVGTDNGLSYFDGKSFTHLTTKQGLTHNIITSILEDKNGNLWFGTSGEGVICYTPQSFNHFTEEQGLAHKSVRAVTEDKSGNLWFGTWGGGVSRYNGKNFVNYDLEKSIPGPGHNDIRSIVEDNDGNLWFGTKNGLNCFDGKNLMHYNTEQGLPDYGIVHLFKDKRGDIWIGTWEGGLSRWDGKNFTNFDAIKEIGADRVRPFCEDKDGKLWIGSWGGGASCYDGKNFTNYTTKQGLGSNLVYSIIEDKDGNILIGTEGGGVSCFNGKGFTNYTVENGLSHNFVSSVLEDNNGNLWIGTFKGLSYLKPANFFTGAKDKSKLENQDDKESYTFGTMDGLKGLLIFQNAIYLDSKNHMWFGTNNSLSMLDLNKFELPESIPRIQLKTIQIKEKNIDYRLLKEESRIRDSNVNTLPETFYKELVFDSIEPFYNYPLNLELPHRYNHLTFYFSAIDWAAPHKLKYQYKMKGLEEHWSFQSPENKADYRNIPYGKYVFKVRAIGASKKWSDIFEYSFVINPPWWHSWWARTLYFIIGVLFIWTIVKWRTAKLKQDRKRLEQKVKERTTEVECQKEELQQQNEEISSQRDQLDLHHKSLEDSILYAKRIQSAVLPPEAYINEILPENFILFKPRDKVSGDFYWIKLINSYIVIAAVDCTGHGVPGAIMSMLGMSFLNEIVQKRKITQANHVLNELRKQIKQALRQTGKKGEADDGMDMALCAFDTKTNILQYSGANNPLYLIQDGELKEFKADKMPIGYYPNEKPSFTNHEIQLSDGDIFYLFSDGFMDQFGGKKGFKFRASNFQKILVENHNKPMVIQKELLEQELKTWMKGYEQTDDILVMGVRV